MNGKENKIILPSGTKIDTPSCSETVGIGIHGKDDETGRFILTIVTSYGGNLIYDSKEEYRRKYHEGYEIMVLTAEDRKFLAELMIARWLEFGGIK